MQEQQSWIIFSQQGMKQSGEGLDIFKGFTM